LETQSEAILPKIYLFSQLTMTTIVNVLQQPVAYIVSSFIL